jgi:hypothetical protein
MYYSKEDITDNAEPESEDYEGSTHLVEKGGAIESRISSYFAYESFNLLRRFFKSAELLDLERKFARYRHMDVAKCFENIYTHTISWATKGKLAAKDEKHQKFSFDARFDSLMKRSNHGETHGILIGAEVSRIFAEVIFQEIDARVDEQLTKVGNLDRRQFVVRRYLDDYFVFYNDPNVADQVRSAILNQLGLYKLYSNEKKEVDEKRPFISPIASTEVSLDEIIKDEFTVRVIPGDAGGQAQRVLRASPLGLLRKIRILAGGAGGEYQAISVFVLNRLYSQLKGLSKLFRSELVFGWKNALLSVVHTSAFLLAVDPRYRTSILACKILLEINAVTGLILSSETEEVHEAILKHVAEVLDRAAHQNHSCGVEIANVLITLKTLKISNRIPIRTLELIWSQHAQGEEPDYFCSLALLYFASSEPAYQALLNAAASTLVDRVVAEGNIFERTESFCLAMDLLGCPWIAIDRKRKVGEKLIRDLQPKAAVNPTSAEIDSLVGECSKQTWFFDWRTRVATQRYLEKKELSISY